MQLQLFASALKKVELCADSPKKAFWRLTLLEHNGEYSIIKESGAMGKILDRRKWPMKSYEHAKKTFSRKVKSKLNPTRKSPRKYQLTYCND